MSIKTEKLRQFNNRRFQHIAEGRSRAEKGTPPGDGKKLRKARARLGARRIAHASTLANVGAMGPAYRCPGSMK